MFMETCYQNIKNLSSNIKSDIIKNSLVANQEYSIQNSFNKFDSMNFFCKPNI